MKLDPDMYQLNTLNIPKHENVNKWANGDGGCGEVWGGVGVQPKHHQRMPLK